MSITNWLVIVVHWIPEIAASRYITPDIHFEFCALPPIKLIQTEWHSIKDIQSTLLPCT